MRLLVLSDIHANLEALEACLEAAPEYDRVLNLGDVVGYGANPNEVIEKVRELGDFFIRGNHDRACAATDSLPGFNPIAGMAVLWTRKILTPDNLAFLRQLPHGPVSPYDDVECVHGSAQDEDEYVIEELEAYPLLLKRVARITFFGHTHLQGGFSLKEQSPIPANLTPRYKSAKGKQKEKLKMKKNVHYLINPGSVGQPRDSDPRAAFLLYDMDEELVTFFRVPYDIKAAQQKILSAGLPERLATRLAE